MLSVRQILSLNMTSTFLDITAGITGKLHKAFAVSTESNFHFSEMSN